MNSADDLDLADLTRAIRESWSASTSNNSRWNKASSSLGQCAVSALVVQDEYGGTLLRALVGDVSHYWNLLPDGREVDLTKDQFDDFDPGEIIERDRGYVLSYPDTAARYDLLRRRVDGTLGRQRAATRLR